MYTGVAGEEKQGLCTGTENFIAINGKASAADQAASEQLLEWLYGSPEGKKAVQTQLAFVAPFTTFTADERPTDPLVKEMFRYLDNKDLTSVAWSFTTFPSQQFKNDLGAALASYAYGKLKWDDLKAQTIKSWASEEAALQ
jgi:raffinose/stachyose/melibiose transport system substrate-binding protein